VNCIKALLLGTVLSFGTCAGASAAIYDFDFSTVDYTVTG